MTTEKKLGMWMDNASAHLMEYNDDITTDIILQNPLMPKRKRLCKKVKA